MPGLGSQGETKLGWDRKGAGVEVKEGWAGPEESRDEVRRGIGLVSGLQVPEVRVGGIGRHWELRQGCGWEGKCRSGS